jgi:hypothetical protein
LKIILLFCICSISIPAWSETEHGTIVVVFGWADGHVAVAADSRGVIGDKTADNVCKITAIDNKLIVSLTGNTGHVTRNKWDYSALTEAQEVSGNFTAKDRSLSDFSSRFANAWANRLVEKLNYQLKVRPTETIALSQDHTLAIGIVVGRDERGEIGIWVIYVKYRTTRDGRKTTYHTIEHKSELPVYLSAGDHEIADEAFSGTSERGRQWWTQLRAASAFLPIEQQSTYIARGLVDLTIRFLPAKVVASHQLQTVGGPIDSINIDRNGRLQWGEHKADCH